MSSRYLRRVKICKIRPRCPRSVASLIVAQETARSVASLIVAQETASLEEKQKRTALSLAADFALRHADSHWGQLQHGEHEESIRAYERNVSVGKKLKHADGLFHGLSNMFLTHQSHGF